MMDYEGIQAEIYFLNMNHIILVQYVSLLQFFSLEGRTVIGHTHTSKDL